jgi:excisionase family DNA binding protein
MPGPTMPDRGTLTIEEAAVRLGIDRGTAYRLARQDKLPTPVIRLGKRMVVGRAGLDRVLAGEPPRDRKEAPDAA